MSDMKRLRVVVELTTRATGVCGFLTDVVTGELLQELDAIEIFVLTYHREGHRHYWMVTVSTHLDPSTLLNYFTRKLQSGCDKTEIGDQEATIDRLSVEDMTAFPPPLDEEDDMDL